MADFPQIAEADATGETAAIYADLRRVSGVPTVNLIWRHLAALPGALPVAWTALAPLIGSQELDTARSRIAAGLKLPPCGPADPLGAGLGEALPEVARIVAAYNLGNLTNVVALTALRLRLEQPNLPTRGTPYTPRPATPPAACRSCRRSPRCRRLSQHPSAPSRPGMTAPAMA